MAINFTSSLFCVRINFVFPLSGSNSFLIGKNIFVFGPTLRPNFVEFVRNQHVFEGRIL